MDMKDHLDAEIHRRDLFSTPIWQTRVPEFEIHAADIERWILYEWQQGSFEKHASGYGYQSPPKLFTPEILDSSPGLTALRDAFQKRVESVLRQRVNQAIQLPPEVHALQGWILIQTNEKWVNGTWHDHFPATLSGCYYLRVPETNRKEEGALAFQRPGAPDPFTPQMQFIKPEAGDMIIFPSHLTHRPQPCPSAEGLRISINMDAYVNWRHWNELGKSVPNPNEWMKRVQNSVAPSEKHPGMVDRHNVKPGQD